MTLRPFELRVMAAILELDNNAAFGNLPAYMRIEADIALMMARRLPRWLKWLLLRRPRGRTRIDIALANLEDIDCVHCVVPVLKDALLLSQRELRERRRFKLTPQGRALLYEYL